MELRRLLFLRQEDIRDFAPLLQLLTQACVLFTVYTLGSSIVKSVIYRINYAHWLDVVLFFLTLSVITVLRSVKRGLVAIERREYTLKRRWVLILGSLFHGGMIIGLRLARGEVNTLRGVIGGLVLSVIAGALWAATFHLFSIHKLVAMPQSQTQ